MRFGVAVLVASPVRRSGGPHGRRCDEAGEDPTAPDAVDRKVRRGGRRPNGTMRPSVMALNSRKLYTRTL